MAMRQSPGPGLRVTRKRKCALKEAEGQLHQFNSELGDAGMHGIWQVRLMSVSRGLRKEGEPELTKEKPVYTV